MEARRQGVSLKVKLVGLSIGITFLLGAASLGVLRYISNTQEEVQLNSFEAYARNLSDAIGAQFFERYGDVQAFSINPSIRAANRQTIVDTLNTYVALYAIYDLVMVVDSKGRLVAVNSKGADGKEINVNPLYSKDFSDAPWVKAVLSGQFTEDKDKAFSGTYVEDVQMDPWVSQVYGGNRLGSAFSAAIKDAAGNVIGAISNRAGSRWFEVVFKELYSGLRKSGFPHAELMLLGKDGTLLFEYTSDPSQDKLRDSIYNWEKLLKFNVAQSGNKAAQKLLAGRGGAKLTPNTRSKEMQIQGYAPVSGGKFIDKIGWSVIVRDSASEAFAKVNQAKAIFYGVFAVIVLMASFVAYVFSTSLSRRLAALAESLSRGSSDVFSAAAQISSSSLELSDAASEQAAAIQQTAASIDQVSAMVKKSADNATQSQKVSQDSRDAAERGQRSVQEMIQAINDISQSNSVIMSQVEDGNRQISEIVKVISEIENKTKVINDIVFQTKLLSFNASVEAARAGEHGKGFAVVAEEVGNLAQMSGNAAKEISSMLESSIQKVEGIVNETKSKVERLVVESKVKVETGTQVANRCGEALTNILSTVQDVDSMVGEIASASNEQAQGVSEINKAMNQLDQVTQKNTGVAQKAATSSEQLKSQSQDLTRMVKDLFFLINGNEGNSVNAIAESNMERRDVVKVVSIATRRERAQVPESKVSMANVAAPSRMVVGSIESSSASQFPSKDDPRFEEV